MLQSAPAHAWSLVRGSYDCDGVDQVTTHKGQILFQPPNVKTYTTMFPSLSINSHCAPKSIYFEVKDLKLTVLV